MYAAPGCREIPGAALGESDLAAATTRGTLAAVARHSLPAVLEATVIPTALFYLAWVGAGPAAAYVSALVWSLGAVVRRWTTGRRMPGLLLLATVGLTVRTALAMATGSSFLYFAQPILGSGLIGLLFLASVGTGRPFVARLAGDFYPLTPEIVGRPAVRRLFRNLTLLWATVSLVKAAAGAGLLLTLPTVALLPTKTAATLTITAVGVVATVVRALRVARDEGLVTAPARPPVLAAY